MMIIYNIFFICTLVLCEALNNVVTENCKLKNGDVGTCVEVSMCPGPGESLLIQCTGFLEVCCKIKDIPASESVPATEPSGCGYSKPGGNILKETSKPVGYADYAEFPWMVALLFDERNENNAVDSYIGGGTLIHPSVVMTAAHKVDRATTPKQLKCRAGVNNLSADNEIYEYQERDVSQIIIHKDFNRVFVHYDVALLVLSSPFNLTNSPHIGLACLELHTPPPGTVCFSMGWGQDYPRSTSYANDLKKITVPLVDNVRCQNQYRNSSLGKTYKLHHTLMCAGGEANVDTCIGDGGSSLVCPIESGDNIRYSVVGMVGYGLECGKENVPGVYVRVPAIYDWVITQVTYQNLNSTTFAY